MNLSSLAAYEIVESISLYGYPQARRLFFRINKALLCCRFCEFRLFGYTVKPVLNGHSKRRPKVGFQGRLSLNAGQKYCRMSILQYFRPSLSYHLSLRPLFCLILSGCLRQVLLYMGWIVL